MFDSFRRTVNITTAAKLMGVSRRTVYNWISDNKIESCIGPSGHNRIYIDSLHKSKEPKGVKP